MMKSRSLLQSRQMRAARALLGWSQDNVALHSKVSIATIRKMELGVISPREETTQKIKDAFIAHGLEFIEPGGVRFAQDEITTYQGIEGLNDFLDDVYLTSKKKVGDIMVVCAHESHFIPSQIAATKIHTDRMSQLKDKVGIKYLLTEDSEALGLHEHAEYRALPPLCDVAPFFVYGDKCALTLHGIHNSFKLVVVQSTDMTQRYRKQFHSMWSKAVPVNRLQVNASRAAQALNNAVTREADSEDGQNFTNRSRRK